VRSNLRKDLRVARLQATRRRLATHLHVVEAERQLASRLVGRERPGDLREELRLGSLGAIDELRAQRRPQAQAAGDELDGWRQMKGRGLDAQAQEVADAFLLVEAAHQGIGNFAIEKRTAPQIV